MPQPAIPIIVEAIDQFTATIARARADVLALQGTVDTANTKIATSSARASQQVTAGQQRLRTGYLLSGVAAIGSAISAGRFNFVLARTGVFANATAQELQGLRQALLQGTEQMQATPIEAAETAQELAKVGLAVRDVTKAVGPTLELMIAAGKELGPNRAAKLMFQGMTLFGKGADQAREVAAGLTAAFAGGAIDANKLSVGFQILATGTSRLRGSFEDTASLLALISNIFPDRINRGVRSAARLFEDLAVQNRRFGFEAAFGVRELNAQGTGFRRIRDIVTDVTSSLLKLNPVQRAARIEQSGLTIEAQRALGFFIDLAEAGIPDMNGQLRKGAQIFKVFGDRIESEVKTGGTLSKLQEVTGETLPGAFKVFTGSVQRLGVAVGTHLEPILVKALNASATAANALARAFEGLDSVGGRVLGTLGGIALALGALKGSRGLLRVVAGVVAPGLGGAILGRAGVGAVGGAAVGGGSGGAVAGAAGGAAGGVAAGGVRGVLGRAAGGLVRKLPLFALAAGVGMTLRDLFALGRLKPGEDLEETPLFATLGRAAGLNFGATTGRERFNLERTRAEIDRLGLDEARVSGVAEAPGGGPAGAEGLLRFIEAAGGLTEALADLRKMAGGGAAVQNVTLEVDRQVLARVIRSTLADDDRVHNGARFAPGF